MKKIIAVAALCLAVTSAKAQYKVVNFSNLHTTICAGPVALDVIVQRISTCAITAVPVGSVPSTATIPFSLGAGALAPYPAALYNIIGVVSNGITVGMPGMPGCPPTGYPNNVPGPCPDFTIWDLSSPVPTAQARWQ